MTVVQVRVAVHRRAARRAHTEQMAPPQFHQMINRESGLLGVSEISADMRGLLAREADDVRAAEAVALFCYQATKWVGAFAAALGGWTRWWSRRVLKPRASRFPRTKD